jgi:hypothetical protein
LRPFFNQFALAVLGVGTVFALERFAMLRITTDDNPQVLTLWLEGRLEGPWVDVLSECWRGVIASSERKRLLVNLNGVTFVDGEGKARLAQMYAQGAEFIADDLMTKAIVAEIAGQ